MGSDSDSDDDYALFGTPLEEVDADEIPRKKPVPIEEQVVTDEQGRRRFHGAFTGGFSAGYFNSVGSKEGWKPKEFISSRAEKQSDKLGQRPEDFMDDEDLSAFGFAPQVLRASSKFQKDPVKDKADRKRKPEAHEPLLAHALINNILKPARDTIGVKLLSAMGWRPGQGIGPRMSRHQKKRIEKSHVRLFGPSLPSSRLNPNDSDGESDEENNFNKKYHEFLFAPDDLPSFVISPKENQFGIGYKGLSRTSVLGNLSTTERHINLFEMPSTALGKPGKSENRNDKNRRGLKISGQAFGIGAYEEEDEDIYAKDDMTNYDFELKPERMESGQSGRQKRVESRWGVVSDKVSDSFDGFELDANDSTKSSLSAFFAPPEIPKDWQPRLRSKPSRFEQEKEKSRNLTPSERKTIVEMEPAKAVATVPTHSDEQLQKLLSTDMEQNENSKSLSFKPFATNPEKQTRYEKYLVCLKNNRGDALHILQPKSMTEWERDREKVEFERASLLYKPLTTSMASRFVSAGTSEDAAKEEKEAELRTNDSIKAAKLKLFGKLTREKIEWHPAKLLCIRFNVKHPYSDYSVIGIPSSHKSKFDIFGQLENKEKENVTTSNKEQEEELISEASQPLDVELVESKTATSSSTADFMKTDEAKEIVKPPIDLFKSIFLDSDSNESEDEEEPVNPPSQQVDPPKPIDTKSNFGGKTFGTGKGLFANIDFDRLNAKPATTQQSEVKKPFETILKPALTGFKSTFKDKEEDKSVELVNDDSSYGPAKPASLPSEPVINLEKDSDSSAEEGWTEKKSEISSKKKKKKDKKKKGKKAKKSSKHKKEKKKKKKRENDTTTETDNSD